MPSGAPDFNYYGGFVCFRLIVQTFRVLSCDLALLTPYLPPDSLKTNNDWGLDEVPTFAKIRYLRGGKAFFPICNTADIFHNRNICQPHSNINNKKKKHNGKCRKFSFSSNTAVYSTYHMPTSTNSNGHKTANYPLTSDVQSNIQ